MTRPATVFSPAQSRAARALLRWSGRRLAADSDLDLSALRRFEAGTGVLDAEALQRLSRALHDGGVVPIHADLAGEGVRLRHSSGEGSLAPARTACAHLPDWLPLGGGETVERQPGVLTRASDRPNKV
jgi:hypothetical protein